MGVDTHLYLNARWDLQDIINVLERTQGKKAEVKAHSDKSLIGYYDVIIGGRRIFMGVNYQTPLGNATYLSLSANDEAHKIFKDLAEVLGGYFVPFDYDDKGEMIQGAITDETGLQYFVKYAILNDGIDNNDIPAFLQSMSKWHDRCKPNNKPTFLIEFDRQLKESE